MTATTRLIQLPSNRMVLGVLMAAVLVLYTGIYTAPLTAQTLVSGDIAGTITDPSGAVVPNATITLKSNDTSQTQRTTTNVQGAYRFSLLQPGNYTVTYNAPNFQSATRQVRVAVGQATLANVQLVLSSATQTVNVTSEAPVVETENGNVSTTFTENQIALVPNPGNDLSYVAQTAPGAIMNTQAGFGNFSTFGISATSNLFTFNGMNENDPFLNLNNSGASNLLLGNNDVREATVVNNGYTGQYGGLAGANVNYVSKSGTNTWHGNAIYWWNGKSLNANEYFNKQAEVLGGLPNKRPFVNDNQWAGSIGGPIVKDKTFFFVDTEGLRVVLPTSQPVLIPSPEFQSAALAGVGGPGTPTGAFYQQLFNLYNNAPGAKGAVPVAGGGCPSTVTTVSTCALQFRSTVTNFNPEWLLTARVDQNIGSKDRAFIHFRSDRGTQATYTDPINSAFNAKSFQPQYEGQLNETHTFGPNTVNQFILSGAWYSAIFKPTDIPAALKLSPFEVDFADGAFNSMGFLLSIWPQGRNSTQYQIIDDLSHTIGNHNFKFGINFKRNDITDFDPGIGTIGDAVTDAGSMLSGLSDVYVQHFVPRLTEPVALYGLGFYGQDEWRVSPAIKLTLAMRFEHNSNPICVTNCFANFTGPFESITHDPNVPYNQVIRPGLAKMITGTKWPMFDYEPRFGFAISPLGSKHSTTVLRGGVGMFADFFPAAIADNLMNNSPLNNSFTLAGLPLNPGLQTTAAAANTAFLSGFNSGGTFASISASNPAFVAPNFFSLGRILRDPRYAEWNLELEQGLGGRTALSINYVGNHGYHEVVQNAGLNAFCDLPSATSLCGLPSGFAGLPTAPPDMRFGTITEAQSVGISNYNGVTTSLKMRFSSVQIQANYTYSHALDEISNGGLLPFNFATNASILNPINPFNLRQLNYGNSDYDVRHYASLNYVFNSPDRYGPHGILGGFVLSGTLFARTGLPFSVFDGATTAALNATNFGTTPGASPQVLAGIAAPMSMSCGGVLDVNPAQPCLNPANFTAPGSLTGFGNQRRNQFRGPGFFNTDVNVVKNFHVPGWEGGTIGIGATAFNVLNHPNFDQPVADVANAAQFGTIIRTVNPPTTPYGAFLGSAASFRIIQLNARLTF